MHFAPVVRCIRLALLASAFKGSALVSQAPNLGGRPDDAAIYAVVLDSVFKHAVYRERDLLVINDSTTIFRREALIPGFWSDFNRVPGVDSVQIADFERRSRTAIALGPISATITSRIDWRIQLVSTATRAAIPRSGKSQDGKPLTSADAFWDGFYRKFPGAVGGIALSAVGYNRDADRAVLLIDVGCGGLCGRGRIVSLRRDGGIWRIVAILGTWVS